MDTKELDALRTERNMFKGKYRALLKLVSKTRDKLVQVTDHIEDEGDRAYFGSTNDADDLRELYHEMMSWIWDAVDETNRMKSDPYADIRRQRARAEKAEAELSRLRSSNEEMIAACEEMEMMLSHEASNHSAQNDERQADKCRYAANEFKDFTERMRALSTLKEEEAK